MSEFTERVYGCVKELDGRVTHHEGGVHLYCNVKGAGPVWLSVYDRGGDVRLMGSGCSKYFDEVMGHDVNAAVRRIVETWRELLAESRRQYGVHLENKKRREEE